LRSEVNEPVDGDDGNRWGKSVEDHVGGLVLEFPDLHDVLVDAEEGGFECVRLCNARGASRSAPGSGA